MEKIKQFFNETMQSEKGKDILTVIIVILVGLGSFELGRLSKEAGSGGIRIEYGDQVGNAVSATELGNLSPNTKNDSISQNSNSVGKTFFASSRGSKYYTISCSAGKTIKQENRIYFTTGEEAERAGYTLSSSCN
ncbi:MAG: hypothetical protein WCW93_02860 [Candidatus Paceibacterota bacterium]